MSHKLGSVARMSEPQVEYMLKVWRENLDELPLRLDAAMYWAGLAIDYGCHSRLQHHERVVKSIKSNMRFLKARIDAAVWCLTHKRIDRFRYACMYFRKDEEHRSAWVTSVLWMWQSKHMSYRTSPIVSFAAAMSTNHLDAFDSPPELRNRA